MSEQLWLSFDVETTGPIPGLHSMLSLGVSAWLDKGGDSFQEVGEFSVNIRPLDYCGWDDDTSKWWDEVDRHGPALVITRTDPQEPFSAMRSLIEWLAELPSNAPHVWAAYPATFDMPFLRYYAQRFAKNEWETMYREDPMQRIACFDIATLASDMLKLPYHRVSRKVMPLNWTKFENPCPHVALNDAKEQAHLLVGMLRDARA